MIIGVADILFKIPEPTTYEVPVKFPIAQAYDVPTRLGPETIDVPVGFDG